MLTRLRQIPTGTYQAEQSLAEYVRQAWHVVEPTVKYVHGWHIDAIADHLEACSDGTIRNLIINIPPRHAKSLTVSVFWPSWLWISRPGTQFLTASYAQDLATRDAVKTRRVILSQWYQERWGRKFTLTGDQNRKQRYENDKGGHRISVGVGGQAVGEGGDILVADDLLKPKDANSTAARVASNDFWDLTMSTRGNNPKTVVKVVIMQRLHQDDLTGHILRKEGGAHYEHLCLPAEYEPRVYVSGIDFSDPRTEPGALLWENRFGSVELETLKGEIGSAQAIAAQLQQRPAPAGGAIYQRAWWDGKSRFDATDKHAQRLSVGRWLSIDTAMKDKETNDFSAWGVYELTPAYQLMVRDIDQRRLLFPQLASTIEELAQRWNYDRKLKGIIIEDKASGTSVIQTLRQSALDWIAELLIPFAPQGSKDFRHRQASLWCDRGAVLFPRPSADVPWLFDFFSGPDAELFNYPAVPHDDRADTLSQVVIYLEHYLAEGWRATQERV